MLQTYTIIFEKSNKKMTYGGRFIHLLQQNRQQLTANGQKDRLTTISFPKNGKWVRKNYFHLWSSGISRINSSAFMQRWTRHRWSASKQIKAYRQTSLSAAAICDSNP